MGKRGWEGREGGGEKGGERKGRKGVRACARAGSSREEAEGGGGGEKGRARARRGIGHGRAAVTSTTTLRCRRRGRRNHLAGPRDGLDELVGTAGLPARTAVRIRRGVGMSPMRARDADHTRRAECASKAGPHLF